jgi:hypothetical protein
MERNIQGNNFASTVVFTAALATVFAIAALRFIPFSPAMPESNLDASWVLPMNQRLIPLTQVPLYVVSEAGRA